MPEFDRPETDSPQLRPERLSDSDLAVDGDVQPPRMREGLPSQYRMRAERHYVDQLLSSSTAVPVRMVRVAAFPAVERLRIRDADTLSQSIREHGVLQPLLVRKVGTSYTVIAGKRRLAAAITAGLEQVPCLVYDVDDEAAARLRTAESVHGDVPPDLRALVGAKLADSIQEIAADLAGVQTTLALLRAPSKPFQKAVALDWLAAQTWRTLWLATLAAQLAGGKSHEMRRAPLAAVIDHVLRGFEPECRLSRLRISAAYESAGSIVVDEAMVALALTGAIIVTLSLLDQRVDGAIEIHTDRLATTGFQIEVIQRQSAVSAETAAQFSNQAFSAPGSSGSLALGAIGLAHATAAYGGAAEMLPATTPEPGSSLRLTFTQA